MARLVLPDMAVHVIHRGHNRSPCFFRPFDYRNYLRYLKVFGARYGCAVHAYCLMTNHVHLLLTPGQTSSCALLMKHLAQCHTQTVNKAFGRTGSLWEGRFRSCLVPTEAYALACYRYIELNPVRAGMVRGPQDYAWSSFLANCSGSDGGLLSPHPALQALGWTSYRALFDIPLEDRLVDDIRDATRGGRRLGAPRKPRGRRPGTNRKQGLSPFKEG
jgi:putative transposase